MKKSLLVVFVLTLGLFFSADAYSQNGVKAKVANNYELIQALDNPSVKTIEFTQEGFYDAILQNVSGGTILTKGGDGTRVTDCNYFINDNDICFVADPTANRAIAGTDDGVDCPAANSGNWEVRAQPLGSDIIFLDATSSDTMDFTVDMPGDYILAYVWAGVTEVLQTYTFYGSPEITEFYGDPEDVCSSVDNGGWTTDIYFDFDSGDVDIVEWYVNGVLETGFPTDPADSPFDFTQLTDCGTYEIILHVENNQNCGVSDDTLYINFWDQAIVNAGPNDTTCGLSYDWLAGFPNYTLGCDDMGTVSTFWTTVGTPPGGVLFNPGGTGVTVDTCGTYLFAYVVENGPSCAVHDTVEITFMPTPIVDAGEDGEICGLTYYDLIGSYDIGCAFGALTTDTWSQLSGPGVATFYPDFDSVAVTLCGEYEFVYTVDSWECTNSDTVTVYFYDLSDVNAGDDASVCGLVYDGLAGNYTATCDNGVTPDEGWMQISGPGTATFSVGLDSVTVTECGYYVFEYGVLNGECEDFDQLAVYFYDTPIVDAGPDTSICGLFYDNVGTYNYDVACDSGNTVVETWAQVSGPGTASFSPGGIDVDLCGAYVFSYTADNGPCTDFDEVAVYFMSEPVADAGINDSICGVNGTLMGSNVADCTDGIDPTVTWSLISGPGTASYDPDTAQDTVGVEVSVCGTYVFQYKVEVSETCKDSATVTFNFYDTPIVDPIPDTDLCTDGATGPYEYTYANPTYSLGCDNATNLDSVWSVLTQPFGGNATFMGNTVTVDVCGTYQFLYTVRNGSEDSQYACNGSAITYLRVYDKPDATASEDQEICGLDATVGGLYTLACDNEITPTVGWSKVSGPGTVTFDPVAADQDTLDVTVSECGEYEFQYIVVNGACSDTAFTTVMFYDDPWFLTMTGSNEIPEDVCGDTSAVFYMYYDADCLDMDADGVWTTAPQAGYTGVATVTESTMGYWYADVTECGVYDFTYTVTNGTCEVDTTFSITFYSAPEPEILPTDDPFACSEVEYCATDLADCADLGTRNFTWHVSGGEFEGGGLTATGNCVTVIWDADYDLEGTLEVCIGIDEVLEEEACIGCTDLTFDLQQPTIAGQVKYWNETETFMPTPFPTDIYGSAPEDYFYVNVYQPIGKGIGVVNDTVKVEPYLYEEGGVVYDYMSYWEFAIPTKEIGCDADLYVKIWDGGLNYLSTVPPPSWETYLGASYTYNNWGGVNATDALAIQIMTTGVEINGAPYNYDWVGLLSDTPDYGYYSQSIADVNTSCTVTALDALIANYRAVGLLGSYPFVGCAVKTTNQFTPNFRVTGRMVSGLDLITFPQPFVEDSVTDIPFDHSGLDYEYFTEAEDQFYDSWIIPWEGADNFMNIYYEAIGDVNASYVPTSGGFKGANVNLTYEGVVGTYVGQIVTVPVSIDRSTEVGAITLNFNYRNDLIEVIGTDFSEENAFIDQENGILNIGWFSADGIDVIADASIAQIKVKVLAEIPQGTELFTLNVNTEIADVNANPIEVDLKAVAISTDKGLLDVADLTTANYPNPFDDATTITYMLPENGTVKVEVYSNTGIKVATLVDEAQESGVQNITFSSHSIEPGVYYYHITVKGESNDYSAVKRMIVIR